MPTKTKTKAKTKNTMHYVRMYGIARSIPKARALSQSCPAHGEYYLRRKGLSRLD
jgi:hypothetical protein